MGFFSGKKKTVVGASVVPLLEEEQIPNSVKSSTIAYILTSDRDPSLPEFIINEFASSLALRQQRAYAYAEEHYSYGLPESDTLIVLSSSSIIITTIETEIGESIEIDYLEYGPINALHVGWETLVADHGYDPLTNELADLSATVGETVYLKDMIPIYAEADFEERNPSSLVYWGVAPTAGFTPFRAADTGAAHTAYIVDELASDDTVEVTYTWDDPVTGEEEDMFVISLSAYDDKDEEEYYQVRYTYNDGIDDHVAFWTYENGSAIHTDIDAILDTPIIGLGEYYPFVHFRREKVSKALPADIGTDDYETSTKYLDILGVDFQELADAIDDNPDIGDIEQAMMVLAAPIDSTAQPCRKYLYDHFNTLYIAGAGALDDPSDAGNASLFTHVIYDREFKFTFRHNGISKLRITGVKAALGKYSSESSDVPFTVIRQQRDEFGALTEVEEEYPATHYLFQHQVNANEYDEIQLFAPELLYHIYGDKAHVAGFGADTLIIPIDKAIIGSGEYSLPEIEELFARSQQLLFNTRVTASAGFFGSLFFKLILIVIVIVTWVWSGGYSSLLLAIEEGALAVLQFVLIQIVTAVVISYAAKIFVNLVGGKAALIIAAIATIYALASGNVAALKGAPWADELLIAASGITRAVNIDIQEQYKDYLKDYQAFLLFVETQEDFLNERRGLLDLQNVIDPFEFIGLAPFSIYGETPDEYFERTIHSSNPGVVSLDAIHEFTDVMLKLPSLHETVGDTFYALI